MSDLTPTCFDILNPPLYLSSAHLPQPYNNRESENASLEILQNLQIDGIINMSTDSPVQPHHRKFYKKNNIDFFEIPIEDSKSPLKDNFLNSVIELYQEQKRNNINYTFLIHCTMGINRSAFAAGAILWAETVENRIWNTPLEMIQWMKKCQARDRKLRLFGNSYFEMHLRKWCDSLDKPTVVLESQHRITRNGTCF